MSNRVKLWVVTLACVAFGAAKLFGFQVDTWHGSAGGPGSGVVNLPAACSLAASAGIPASNRAVAATRYRAGYRMSSIGDGVRLRKPSNMGPAVVTFSNPGIAVVAELVDGDFVISGEDLITLRDNDVLEIGVRLQSCKAYLDILIVLEPGDSSFIVLVE